ncbi:hypothetical protein L21SP5_03279 [Salinivirga cyanobacteriivorans]|uniref:Secretion system C-terminal sorting domain-containing protein n=1 Tax=Salinivirga cyanobacteriivorans TaxID=1307839 RepID=A0A0S2I407_9BACT|nr:T9SS type A sorting domain-containing protein [Salinivirga cyanobacteriivorans]ALO16893.1 hypothetical protein L21SP5_03279 [Salinivirga cyanobacteriivorans]
MKTLLITTLIFLCHINLNSQSISKDVISTSGENFENQNLGVKLSYTLGETVTGSYYDALSGLYLEQGFQSGAIDNVNAIADHSLSDQLHIYPNPFSNFLNIEFTNDNLADYQIKLYNNLGKLQKLYQERGKTTLNMQDLEPGIYYLFITYNNNILSQTKVIKQ